MKLCDFKVKVFDPDTDGFNTRAINHSPCFQALNTGDPMAYNSYNHAMLLTEGLWKGKLEIRDHDHLLDLFHDIENNGYRRDSFIKVGHGNICDGQHRASILLFLFGNVEVVWGSERGTIVPVLKEGQWAR